jgi:hypothetical protein
MPSVVKGMSFRVSMFCSIQNIGRNSYAWNLQFVNNVIYYNWGQSTYDTDDLGRCWLSLNLLFASSHSLLIYLDFHVLLLWTFLKYVFLSWNVDNGYVCAYLLQWGIYQF